MRTFTIILSLGMTVMLLGCGLLNGGKENPPNSEPDDAVGGAISSVARSTVRR